MLLGFAGLAAVSLENVSFGHAHLAVVRALHHHHHIYFGAHEHSEHSGEQPGSDPVAPDPEDSSAPRESATVSVGPSLFQPVGASALAAPLVASMPLMPDLALLRVVRPVILPARPRGPPASLLLPTSLGRKDIQSVDSRKR